MGHSNRLDELFLWVVIYHFNGQRCKGVTISDLGRIKEVKDGQQSLFKFVECIM